MLQFAVPISRANDRLQSRRRLRRIVFFGFARSGAAPTAETARERPFHTGGDHAQ